jgi:hypothetical protein
LGTHLVGFAFAGQSLTSIPEIPMRSFVLAFAALALASPAIARAQDVGERTASPESHLPASDLAPGQDDLQEAVAAAAAHPLGTLENPVRVGGPEGELAYLARLRCADGSSPRVGSREEAGVDTFGSIARAYSLTCGSSGARIVSDIYHEEHVEDRAPPGFTIRAN